MTKKANTYNQKFKHLIQYGKH